LYRGNVIGVVDLGRLLVGVPCRLQLSSRIVVLRGSNDARFGLLAERVTEARTLDLTTLAQPPVRGSLCVSGTVVDAGHLVHVLDPRAILPSSSPAWQEGGVPA
jgi:chemotaxis signal transduction protein